MVFEMSCLIKYCYIIFTLRRRRTEEKKHKERKGARVSGTLALRALSFPVSRE
jgi:hypothetical protein